MIKDINCAELLRRIQSGEKLHLIDVRMPYEYAGGHIPGTINLPLPDVESNLPGVPADAEVIMICQAGVRSAAACERVQSNYPNLYNLTGGTCGWIASGYEVELDPNS